MAILWKFHQDQMFCHIKIIKVKRNMREAVLTGYLTKHLYHLSQLDPLAPTVATASSEDL